MLAFLVEVLEKGMQQVQIPVLNVIHCMLHYIDLSTQPAQPISGDLLRVIAKYLDVRTLKQYFTAYDIVRKYFFFCYRIHIGKKH